MEPVAGEISLNIVHVHRFHGTALVCCAVEQEAVIPDHPSRELFGIIEHDTFQQAPVRERGNIGKFREEGKDIVACLLRIGMGQRTHAGGE